MHLSLSTPTLLLALAVGTSSAASVIARQDLGTVAIIGTFTDTACRAGQTDYSQTALNHWGTCSNLPGNSMKIWWLAKGCTGTFHLFLWLRWIWLWVRRGFGGAC
jgi:hypothetical protein